MRKPVHPAEMLAARNLRVAILRLLEQIFARLSETIALTRGFRRSI